MSTNTAGLTPAEYALIAGLVQRGLGTIGQEIDAAMAKIAPPASPAEPTPEPDVVVE